MVDIKEYNERETKNLEAYLMLKREEKEFWERNTGGFSGNSKAGKAYDSLTDRMHALNPLARKEDEDFGQGSLYDLHSGYIRKLPLNSIDGKIINIVEECLKEDWTFLQIRISKSGVRVNYVLIFKCNEEVDYDKLKKNLRKRKLGEEYYSNHEYSCKFIASVGLDNAEERLAEALSGRYKLTGIKATADVDWPGQGEGPSVNYEYLCIDLYMEDKCLVRKQFRDKLREAEKRLIEAKDDLRMYSG